jgi:hypothetical protein
MAHEVPNPLGVGRHLGSQPRANASITIIPPFVYRMLESSGIGSTAKLPKEARPLGRAFSMQKS